MKLKDAIPGIMYVVLEEVRDTLEVGDHIVKYDNGDMSVVEAQMAWLDVEDVKNMGEIQIELDVGRITTKIEKLTKELAHLARVLASGGKNETTDV